MAEAKGTVNDRYQTVAINKVKPHPKNPRKGDLEAIKESIRANGFYGALVVQRKSGRILVGNHRWKAAKQLGFKEVPVVYVDVDDDRALRILLADNRTADLANWDLPDLTGVLKGLDELEGTGFAPIDLQDLLETLAGPKPPEAFSDPEQQELANECPKCHFRW